MNTLVSKDEPLRTSLAHVGYLILKELEAAEGGRISLDALWQKLGTREVREYRPIMFALVFLHAVGAVDFRAPYLYCA